MEGVEISDFTLRDRTGFRCHGDAFPPRGREGSYPGACQTSFLSMYDGESGMYFGCHDPHHNYKMVEWKNLDSGVKLMYKVYPGRTEAEFSYDFELCLGSQGGSWYDSAEIYRNFLESSGFFRMPKLRENAGLPNWVFESPVVAAYCVRGEKDTGDMSDNCYFPYPKALPYLERLEKALDSRLMALLMRWEGTAPWSPPYVWPPHGGKEPFNDFVERMHARGNTVGVYCSGISWTEQSGNCPEYERHGEFVSEGLADVVEVGPSGMLTDSSVCGWPIRRGYNLCPTEEWTRKTAVREIGKIVSESEVDYVQFFDQNLGGNAYACYSKKHGISEMREETDRASARPVLIGCESAAAEPFVDQLMFNDLRYNINYFFGTPVPAYNYLFGEYVKNFMGNQNTSSMWIDLNTCTDHIYLRYAYSFSQGDILTVVLGRERKVSYCC